MQLLNPYLICFGKIVIHILVTVNQLTIGDNKDNIYKWYNKKYSYNDRLIPMKTIASIITNNSKYLKNYH